MTIRASGRSMEPTILDGDLLAIRRVDPFRFSPSSDKIYVIDTEDGASVKRLRIDGHHLRCISDNPDNPPFTVPLPSVRGIFEVIAILREL